jgi:hypothetical protein
MNNDALVAALGMDAVAAVHGYRLHVISEAERRGLRLINGALPGAETMEWPSWSAACRAVKAAWARF